MSTGTGADGSQEDSIVRHLPDVVLRYDREGRILFANEAIRGVAGDPPAHYIGRLATEADPDPAVARQFAEAREAVLATGEPVTIEVRRVRPDGVCWFEYRLLPERVTDGRIETILAIGREVTEAHRALDAVRASEARYRALVEATSQVVFSAGPGGELGDTLDEWIRYTGQRADPNRRAGDEWLEVVHPDDRAAAWAVWTRALRAGSVYEAQYRLYRQADGEWRTVVARAAPVRDAAGRILEWIGTVTDVTEQVALQRTLEATQRRLATLLSNLPGLAYRVRDDERRTTEIVSEGVLALTGHPAEAFGPEAMGLADLVVPEHHARLLAAIRGGLETGRPFEVTYRIARADGQRRWVLERGRGVPGEEPGATAVEGLIVDVTGRQEARAALEAERAQLAEAQRIARLGSWTFDAATNTLRVTEQWGLITGVGEEEMRDPIATLLRSLVPEDVPLLEAKRTEIDRDRPAESEGRWHIRRPDGEVRVLHVRSTWRYDAEGRRIGGAGTFQDVTEQAAAEAEVARQRELLEESQRLAHVGSWEFDLRTKAVTWSDELYRMAGVPKTDAPLTLASLCRIVHPDDFPHVKANVERAVATGEVIDQECRLIHPDGAMRLIQARVRPVRDEHGTTVRVVSSCQDVTEQRQLEEQVRQTQKMEALGLLAGSVAHDFNNLLSAILGGAELARLEVPDDTPIAADLDEIRNASERAAELTRQLLAFSRKQARRPRVLDLRESVQRGEKILRRILPESLILDVSLAPAPCVVRADAGQIEQVLVNLVVNARDAILAAQTRAPDAPPDARAPGVVAVEVGPCTMHGGAAAPPGSYVSLVVRDNGIGMNAATMQRIFEPFFTTKPEGEGTGLGLSTVFGIVAQNGGTIDVESTPGVGTTFTVLLPALAEPTDVGESGVAALPGGSETILLVEDERVVRTMAARLLERHGYRVVAVRHGADAMAVWRGRTEAIDLVVTDLQMPEMSGPALVRTLRAECPTLPVVLMSGYAGGAGGVETALLQDVVFMEKPFTAEALLRRVREALDRSPNPSEAGRR
ncbi:MAG: PAS domain-containing protein [Gemmatimonadetes bacterium]|nr:PAS domain-containing protein [Gemmatimonadota bacterium]